MYRVSLTMPLLFAIAVTDMPESFIVSLKSCLFNSLSLLSKKC
nr:MAG TPA: hypothetical protein [Caudoviricetes sp.]